jgi:hypothetical protein
MPERNWAEINKQLEGITRQLSQGAGTARAMQDLLHSQNKDLGSVTGLLPEADDFTGGGLIDRPGEMPHLLGRSREMMKMTGKSYEDFSSKVRGGAWVAQKMGLGRAFGINTTLSSASFGESWAGQAGTQGFGGLGRAQAEELDQRLRLSAANSSTANMLGATAKMAEAGLIKGLDLKTKQGQEALANMATMNQQQWFQTMQQHGVSAATASTFLGARGANQEAISRHGLQDVVRGIQGQQVRQIMSDTMAGGAMGNLRQSGLDMGTAGGISQVIGRSMTQEIERLQRTNPELLSDASRAGERNKALMDATKRDLAKLGIRAPEQVLNQAVASAYHTMENRIQQDSRLSQFGNVSGLVAMNRPDILASAAERSREAGRRGDLANRAGGTMSTDIIRSISGQIQRAKKGDDLIGIAATALGGIKREELEKRLGGKEEAKKILEDLRTSKDPSLKEQRGTARGGTDGAHGSGTGGGPPQGPNRLTLDGKLDMKTGAISGEASTSATPNNRNK